MKTKLREFKLKNLNKPIIGSLNINSIRNKFEQLKYFIKDEIDILLINETKLDESFPTAQFSIEGFSKLHRLDRNENGGGILLYVKENIPSKILSKHYFSCDMEGIFIEINLRKVKWVLFGTYHPPSQNDQYYFDQVERALDIYKGSFENFLLFDFAM